MSLFDLGAGLVLAVSVLVGWIRGGTREVAWVAAVVIAAIVAVLALRFTSPIARQAIHTPWLANVAAILLLFGATYILLRVVAAALSRRIHQTDGLGNVDRAMGAGFGFVRAMVILGLANLTLNAITPPERLPTWISGALLYPVSSGSADVLRVFAPQGARLAGQVAPVVGHAITNADDNSNNAQGSAAQPYGDPASPSGARPARQEHPR